MAVYRFKVSFEEHDEISREIDIRADQTFEDLHYAIQQAVGFDASQPASFYMSNDHWTKGREISLNKMPDRNGEENVLMKNAVLFDWISDPHQKIYYLFDYTTQWTFYVELSRIYVNDDIRKKYPVCVKVTGDAPKQRAVVMPLKKNELEIAEEETLLIEDEYTADATDEEEVVLNPEEADDINTGEDGQEQITEESGGEEEEP
ncbi:MAG: hypothetical protein ACHQNT_07090 [Bacteroidia bacterium]